MHGRKERKKKLNAMRCGRVIIRPVRKTIAVSSLITMSVLVVPAASGTHGNSHLSLRAQNKNTHIHISHSLEDMISDFKPRDSIIPQLRDERGRGQRVRWVCGNKKQTGRLNLEAGGRAGRPRRSEAGAQRKNKLSFPSIRFDNSGKRRGACPYKENEVCGWSICRARRQARVEPGIATTVRFFVFVSTGRRSLIFAVCICMHQDGPTHTHYCKCPSLSLIGCLLGRRMRTPARTDGRRLGPRVAVARTRGDEDVPLPNH
jgi:hypothetical protein